MPEQPSGVGNLLWAYALIDGLASSGITDAVISPGSRSTPLVLACDAHPAINITLQVDERCAAFFALGQARASGHATLLIATSGSAPAHWYPAVIEASHSNLPLILLSADRPPELHGWGANQTTDQQRLFGSHLRTFHDPGPAEPDPASRQRLWQLGNQAAREALQPHPGPVQINLPFREPLVPAHPPELPPPAALSPPPVSTPAVENEALRATCAQLSGKPGIILCGATDLGEPFAAAVTRLATQLQCPILADPLSNLRFAPPDKALVISRYDAFLHSDQAELKPHWILRFGALPVAKSLLHYMEQSAAPVILCDPYRQWPVDPPHTEIRLNADPARLCDAIVAQAPAPAPADWLERFQTREQISQQAMSPTTLDDQPFEGCLIQSLLMALPENSLLFSGNSMPIRQLDSWSGRLEKRLHLHANRGVSGIDGNLSTFIGMANQGYPAAVALLGDLAFYHDMNGLLAAAGRDLVIVLLNNNGGGIFGYLPQASLPGYDAYWNTATHLDFRHSATLYGLGYQRVTRQSAFPAALDQALQLGGPQLIEVIIDRAFSIAHHRHYRAQVAAALASEMR
ncbi:2-succinyl-5-enolpyruvyl-6-hydroxy-3-cyclohexene-1-carboxylic-acid synthase [Sedimenticola sp.]|uniref:2-succinyl-5-enolpyruvyl-6-hydroxy-3- cyclohexene-1-carboxylic-acid synthase n=1 Tax=Sedimenticola sp. TaxID=1940285 RepID=UPI003D0FC4C6